ncbi:GNAT family acetyltransferase [Sediminicola sp. YIK13]|uniref:GNAT family N-acetyltransferase n=1 Tax=Sediminicola sp. YIK13 TaxID=1453352 RepID=UPI0007214632|nr:GNAT family N-acetyltransferase [Sediminicola sp. YIK13]ALM07070.1 GNAT family acetyltransferase [Sediminicola sp. YIK13]
MKITNSNTADIPEIFRLYRLATAFQKTKKCVQWPEFSTELVSKEIAESRQWKLMIGQIVACVWAVTFEDPEIWEEKDVDKAMYIHRIATNPEYRGQHLVEHIVTWSKGYAQENKLDYIRMDTVGENLGLISHYKKCGFEYLGLTKLKSTVSLPAHYENACVSLFQIKL